MYLAWLFAALTPWELHMFPGVGARKPIPGAAVAAREGIKAPNKVFDTLVRSYNNLVTIRTVMQAVGGGQMWARNTAGMFVRGLGPDWRNQVQCCVLLDLAKTWKDNETEPCMYYLPLRLHIADLSLCSALIALECEALLSACNTLVCKINELGVTNAYDVHPILDVRLSPVRRVLC